MCDHCVRLPRAGAWVTSQGPAIGINGATLEPVGFRCTRSCGDLRYDSGTVHKKQWGIDVARPGKKTQNETGANVGYEAQLWQMAGALRGSMDAAEYQHVVLGLIFLKHSSDGFERVPLHCATALAS